MSLVTPEEFRKNNIMIMAFTDEQKRLRTRFLKRAKYEYFDQNSYKIDDCICAKGGITDITNYARITPNTRFVTVYQLEHWDKPLPKKMTIAEIEKELGYLIEVVE